MVCNTPAVVLLQLVMPYFFCVICFIPCVWATMWICSSDILDKQSRDTQARQIDCGPVPFDHRFLFYQRDWEWLPCIMEIWRTLVYPLVGPCTVRRRGQERSQSTSLSAFYLHNARATILTAFYYMEYTIIKNKANLRDVIASNRPSNLSQIAFNLSIYQPMGSWNLMDGIKKTRGHLFYTTSSFVNHLKSIANFILEIQSGNAQFGSKSAIFVPCYLEIWWMTLKTNRAHPLYYVKPCASLQSHGWI